MQWITLIILIVILALAILSRSGILKLLRKVTRMQEQIDALRAQVAASTTVMTSAAALITGLADQIEKAQDDPAEIQSIADTLRASTTDLSAAVAAGTQAEGEPAAEPAAGAGAGTEGTGGAGAGDGGGAGGEV